jgi:hypothetical protein
MIAPELSWSVEKRHICKQRGKSKNGKSLLSSYGLHLYRAQAAVRADLFKVRVIGGGWEIADWLCQEVPGLCHCSRGPSMTSIPHLQDNKHSFSSTVSFLYGTNGHGPLVASATASSPLVITIKSDGQR